jgi:uncharacterized coiled-coil protein SlyX
MEAQLQQSIPKKTHQEVVAKMQGQIDTLNGELERTKSELKTTTTVGERVDHLGTQVSAQNESLSNLTAQINSQNQIINGLDSLVSNQKGTVETQAAAIQELSSAFSKGMEALDAKLSRDTVPVLLYNQTLSKVGEIEERMRFMVERADYTALQKRCDELTERITTMVPTTDYLALQAQFANYVPKAQYEELQRAYANTVPRDQYAESLNRVAELESKLTNTVPKSDYDELTAKIASITAGVTTAEISMELATPSAEIDIPAPAAQVEQAQAPVEAKPVLEVPQAADATVAEAPVLEAGETSAVENKPSGVPQCEAPTEISEMQSQLSEIKAQSETGATTFTAKVVVDSSFGFNFWKTTFCARSGMEFLDDLEHVPVEVLEAHSRNGDFERWFKDVLQDAYSADSLRAIREHGNFAGEELRSQIVAVISPRYRS